MCSWNELKNMLVEKNYSCLFITMLGCDIALDFIHLFERYPDCDSSAFDFVVADRFQEAIVLNISIRDLEDTTDSFCFIR
jgi:hypothetical protein